MNKPVDEYRKQEMCPHCDRVRECRKNLRTGAGVVTTWINCPHRDRCEQEIMPGFEPDVHSSYAKGDDNGR